MTILAICFLAVSVPVETLYSWPGGLTNPYYLVKVVGWTLLAFGVMHVRRGRPQLGQVLLAGGFGWFAANFWRAVADRFSDLEAGGTLRLGSIELWFAGSCLLVSMLGLALAVSATTRRR